MRTLQTYLVFILGAVFIIGCADAAKVGQTDGDLSADRPDVPSFSKGKADGGTPLIEKGRLNFGGSLEGSFEMIDSFHEYRFEASEGGVATLDITGAQGEPRLDTKVFVLGPVGTDGALPLVDYDIEPGPTSLESIDIPQTGTYLITVGTMSGATAQSGFEPLSRFAVLGALNNLEPSRFADVFSLTQRVLDELRSLREGSIIRDIDQLLALETVSPRVVETMVDDLKDARGLRQAVVNTDGTVAAAAILGVVNNANIDQLVSAGLTNTKAQTVYAETREERIDSLSTLRRLSVVNRNDIGSISGNIYDSLEFKRTYDIGLDCANDQCLTNSVSTSRTHKEAVKQCNQTAEDARQSTSSARGYIEADQNQRQCLRDANNRVLPYIAELKLGQSDNVVNDDNIDELTNVVADSLDKQRQQARQACKLIGLAQARASSGPKVRCQRQNEQMLARLIETHVDLEGVEEPLKTSYESVRSRARHSSCFHGYTDEQIRLNRGMLEQHTECLAEDIEQMKAEFGDKLASMSRMYSPRQKAMAAIEGLFNDTNRFANVLKDASSEQLSADEIERRKAQLKFEARVLQSDLLAPLFD
jgi:hypothetical protein